MPSSSPTKATSEKEQGNGTVTRRTSTRARVPNWRLQYPGERAGADDSGEVLEVDDNMEEEDEQNGGGVGGDSDAEGAEEDEVADDDDEDEDADADDDANSEDADAEDTDSEAALLEEGDGNEEHDGTKDNPDNLSYVARQAKSVLDILDSAKKVHVSVSRATELVDLVAQYQRDFPLGTKTENGQRTAELANLHARFYKGVTPESDPKAGWRRQADGRLVPGWKDGATLVKVVQSWTSALRKPVRNWVLGMDKLPSGVVTIRSACPDFTQAQTDFVLALITCSDELAQQQQAKTDKRVKAEELRQGKKLNREIVDSAVVGKRHRDMPSGVSITQTLPTPKKPRGPGDRMADAFEHALEKLTSSGSEDFSDVKHEVETVKAQMSTMESKMNGQMSTLSNSMNEIRMSMLNMEKLLMSLSKQ